MPLKIAKMPKMRPHLLALALVVGLVLVVGPYAREAHACSCAGSSRTTEEWFQRSDAVFSGEVVEIGKLPPEPPGTTTMTMPFLNPVTFDVKEAWKGVSGDSVVVHGQGPGVSCGLNFEREETYLVFAGYVGEGEDRALQTDYCGNTFAASEETARNILGPPPETLPETGGVRSELKNRSPGPAYVLAAGVVLLAAGTLVAGLAVRRTGR